MVGETWFCCGECIGKGSFASGDFFNVHNDVAW